MVLGRVGLLTPWHGANVGEFAVFCLAFPYLISLAHLLALVRLYPVAAQRELLGGTFPFAFSCCLFGLCLRGRRRALVTRSGSARRGWWWWRLTWHFGSELQ